MTDVVAWLALAVALGSLWLSYLGYRQGRPSLSATAHITLLMTEEGEDWSLATVTVVNSSSVPVTIDSVEWASEDVWATWAEMSSGQPLPHRLEGHSAASWRLKHIGKEVVLPPDVTAAQRPLKVEVTVDKIGRKRRLTS